MSRGLDLCNWYRMGCEESCAALNSAANARCTNSVPCRADTGAFWPSAAVVIVSQSGISLRTLRTLGDLLALQTGLKIGNLPV